MLGLPYVRHTTTTKVKVDHCDRFIWSWKVLKSWKQPNFSISGLLVDQSQQSRLKGSGRIALYKSLENEHGAIEIFYWNSNFVYNGDSPQHRCSDSFHIMSDTLLWCYQGQFRTDWQSSASSYDLRFPFQWQSCENGKKSKLPCRGYIALLKTNCVV